MENKVSQELLQYLKQQKADGSPGYSGDAALAEQYG